MEGKGGGKGSRGRRRSSAEFIQRVNLFEELGDDGGKKKKEELLVMNNPEEPKFIFKNFTDICSTLPSTSP